MVVWRSDIISCIISFSYVYLSLISPTKEWRGGWVGREVCFHDPLPPPVVTKGFTRIHPGRPIRIPLLLVRQGSKQGDWKNTLSLTSLSFSSPSPTGITWLGCRENNLEGKGRSEEHGIRSKDINSWLYIRGKAVAKITLLEITEDDINRCLDYNLHIYGSIGYNLYIYA